MTARTTVNTKRHLEGPVVLSQPTKTGTFMQNIISSLLLLPLLEHECTVCNKIPDSFQLHQRIMLLGVTGLGICLHAVVQILCGHYYLQQCLSSLSPCNLALFRFMHIAQSKSCCVCTISTIIKAMPSGGTDPVTDCS
jgi:hypothetical protein